jgi:hypothetical protein
MTTEVSSSDVLRAQMAGLVLSPSDMAYEDARRVHNGLIDRRLCLRAPWGSLGGQRPIMADYVTLTGPQDGATAAGGRSC